MFMGGFLAVRLVLIDTTLLQKPSQLSLFLAKVLLHDMVQYKLIMNMKWMGGPSNKVQHIVNQASITWRKKY